MLLTDPPTLTRLSATRLGELIRTGEVSPVEVIEAHLEQIDVQSHLNAIVTPRAAEARQEAAEAERAQLRGEIGHAPLNGVPFTVKDTIATAGLRTTCGSASMSDHVPTLDATSVSRMRSAGAILLGKTNCPEFGLGVHTVNALFGETKSPLGNVTPGGSSGGESAAIASGCSPLGLGTDFGGSLRWPAHCTGIAALRPTVGRVPRTGQLPALGPEEPAMPNEISLQGRLQVIGPIARSVEDLELALSVIGGPDGLDPAVAPVTHRRDATVHGLPVAWWGGGRTVRSDVSAVVGQAAGWLDECGAEVAQEHPLAIRSADELYGRLRALDGLEEVRRALRNSEARPTPALSRILERNKRSSAAGLAELWRDRDRLRAEVLAFLDVHNVLVLPVATDPAFATSNADQVDLLLRWDTVAPCRAISFFELPSVVVPCGRVADGLPVGVQVVARPYREDEAFAVARVLEARWAGLEGEPV